MGFFEVIHALLTRVVHIIAISLYALWNTYIAPLGISLIQLVVGMMKGMWYGPFFGTKDHIPDAILGPQPEQTIDLYPFPTQWKPPVSFVRVIGLILGFGLGFRVYIQLLLLIARSAWFGPFPEYLATSDGFWTELPTPAYRNLLSRFLGGVFGLGVGFMFLCNAFVLIIKGFIFGCNPVLFHFSDGLLLPAETRFPSSALGACFGGIFGLGLGAYPFANFLTAALRGVWFGAFPEIFTYDQHLIPIGSTTAYKTRFGRVIGLICGVYLGGFGLINTAFLVLWGFYYGAIGESYIRDGILGQPTYPLRTAFGKAFGCIFGLYFGFRTLLDIVFAVVTHFWKYFAIFLNLVGRFARFIYEHILMNVARIICYLALGAWLGLNVERCHLSDGMFKPPKDVYTHGLTPISPLDECMRMVGAISFGGCVGLRCILNFLTALPRAAWHGPIPPEMIIDDGFPCMKVPLRPLRHYVTKSIGAFVGLGLGLRTYVLLFGIMARGHWFGAFPVQLTMKDGMLGLPTVPIYRSPLGEAAGWLCGLAVGARAVVSCCTVIPKGIWLGVAPELFVLRDAVLDRGGTWLSPFGRALGIFGCFMGMHFLVNCVCLFFRAAWLGVLGTFYFRDGLFGPPRTVLVGTTGKLLGITLGLVVGWRLFVDLVVLGARSSWFGAWGVLYVKRSNRKSRGIITTDPSADDDISQSKAAIVRPEDLALPPSPSQFTLNSSASLLEERQIISSAIMATDEVSVSQRPRTELEATPLSDGSEDSLIPAEREISTQPRAIMIDIVHGGPEKNFSSSAQVPTFPIYWYTTIYNGVANGRSDYLWMTEGASTLLGKCAGSIFLALLFSGLGAIIVVFGYLPSDLWKNPPSNYPSVLTIWYRSNFGPVVIVSSVGLVMGAGLGLLGMRNVLSPFFYTRTVGPAFVKNVWFPVFLPCIEVVAVTVALVLYIPVLCVVSTLRRFLRSVWYLSTKLRSRPLTVGKFVKIATRLAMPIILSIATAYILGPVLAESSSVLSISGLWAYARVPIFGFLIACAGMPIIDAFLRKFLKSHRFTVIMPESRVRLHAASLKEEEVLELDGLFLERVKATKQGYGINDTAGPLRGWIRMIGFRSQDETRVKRLHDKYRAAKNVNVSHGMSEDEIMWVKEVRSRRASEVAATRRLSGPAWSHAITSSISRKSKSGVGVGFADEVRHGKVLGEVFETEARCYRVAAEANNLSIWVTSRQITEE